MWDLFVSVPDHCLSFYFELVWAGCFVGVQGFKQLFNAFYGDLYIRHLTVLVGLER